MRFENKFGMFIHWGLYALGGKHEQEYARMDVPREQYEARRERFDPVDYDPESWVKAAKAAGMKYLCFTAKHHDGFCMWDTATTDYSVTHTPYGRDVLAMLAAACQKHGMLLSLYYSNPDWHHENAYNPLSSHQWKAPYPEKADRERYLDYVRRQVTELLTGYGRIYSFFWDIPPGFCEPEMNRLIRRLMPGILINDRGYDEGDFSTPEREEGEDGGTRRFRRMTEACNSVGEESWGYRENEDYYSIRHLTSSIDRVMARGGSYLLNVGPTGRGALPAEATSVLARVGDWYTRMGGCLEDTEEDPFAYELQTGKCIVNRKDGVSYFHFSDGLISSAVLFKRYPSPPRSVVLVNTGEPLPFEIGPVPLVQDKVCGVCRDAVLRISRIPTDALASEPIVLAIRWS